MVATDWAFGEPSGVVSGLQARNWPANTLRLREFSVYEALKVKPDDVKWKAHTFDLQHRHLEYADLSWSNLGNIDLRDARLQGATLDQAQLQAASLNDAKLQGASLGSTALQGASLEGAQLQGASLDGAQLQGASLNDAKLQGASLYAAELQGARNLDGAWLQGASLAYADLQGASLEKAHLQGASLEVAHLEGASLGRAELQGASLVEAHLWRADLGEVDPENVAQSRLDRILWSSGRAPPAWANWTIWRENNPTWNDQSYAELREMMEEIPEGELRNAALRRVERLDCEKTGESLASCDLNAEAPAAVYKWRSTLELQRAPDVGEYRWELAQLLSNLVCDGDAGADAIHVLRGLAKNSRLEAAGGEGAKLIATILKDKHSCPLSAALTADDRAKLLAVEKYIEEVAKAEAESATSPPTASRKGRRKK